MQNENKVQKWKQKCKVLTLECLDPHPLPA